MSEHNGHDSREGLAEGNAANDGAEKAAPKRGTPIFEVVIQPTIAVLNATPLHHFKIWPDGHVEGFDGLGGAVIVYNRVPNLLMTIGQPIFDVANTISEAARELSKGSIVKESGHG